MNVRVTKVQKVLHGILEKFKTGDVPKAIAYALFPITETPSDKWSFMNRMIMFLSGTIDARGIRQWNKVGRYVKLGSKAIYILVPYFAKKKRLDDGEIETLRGFMAKPVFSVEDTEGEPLDYEKAASSLELPLLERAEELGITVSTTSPQLKFFGAYRAASKEIYLATPEEVVFFHELSHAAYDICISKLKPGQTWDQEIIAELSAQALCRLIGKKPNDTLGNSYRYIERYAEKAGLKPLTACLKVIDDVERVLNFILGKEVTKDVEHPVERTS